MYNYLKLMQEVLDQGEWTDDRTGTGTISTFGKTLRWDLQKSFPAVTTKKLAWKSVVGELLWFLEGSTNIYRLAKLTHGNGEKRTIWHPNYEKQAVALGYQHGELGPVYGSQWRNFNGVDQIRNLLDGIKKDPFGRRHLVSAWNPADMYKMALPPCHYSFGVKITPSGKLNLFFTMRSNDVFLGLPFNIASYALLAHILAKLTGYEVGELVYFGADVHIYKDHIEQCKEQLSRKPFTGKVTLEMPHFTSLYDLTQYTSDAFKLKGYESHGTIKANMSA